VYIDLLFLFKIFKEKTMGRLKELVLSAPEQVIRQINCGTFIGGIAALEKEINFRRSGKALKISTPLIYADSVRDGKTKAANDNTLL
jgi:hypothetical protein